MTREEIARRCEELAGERERLARKAAGLSYPTGQAALNAGANLHDAAQMATRTRGGAR